jgi:hypothetical protein
MKGNEGWTDFASEISREVSPLKEEEHTEGRNKE